MRLIDADALVDHLRKDPLFRFVEQYGIDGVIDAAPTIDAIPVIRCNDCKYLKWHILQYLEGGKEMTRIYNECEYLDCCCEPTDFCSYAERR